MTTGTTPPNETPSDERTRAFDPVWAYTTWKPKPNSTQAWELGLPAGHRFWYVKRRDRVTDKVQFMPHCTCRWKHTDWVMSTKFAKHLFLRHATTVPPIPQQGELALGT